MRILPSICALREWLEPIAIIVNPKSRTTGSLPSLIMHGAKSSASVITATDYALPSFVVGQMLPLACAENKIAYPVVVLDSVFVVNNLAVSEVATDMFFHDEAMLVNSPPRLHGTRMPSGGHGNIAVTVRNAASFVSWRLLGVHRPKFVSAFCASLRGTIKPPCFSDLFAAVLALCKFAWVSNPFSGSLVVFHVLCRKDNHAL